jgi:hypothetical protein
MIIRERVLASIAVVLTLACAPPSPPTPPHPRSPDEMGPLMTRAETDTELVALRTDREIDAAAIPLVPASTIPTQPAPAAVDAGAAADAAKVAGAATLVGRYRYDSGRSNMRKSVDAVVGEMGVLSRGIARKRLLAANDVPKSIAIRQEGTEVTVEIDKRVYTATLGGGSRRVKGLNGDPSRMRLAMRGDALYQTFQTDEGERINAFSAREDGGLNMTVRITSRQLPDDVFYRLVFDPQ